MRAVVNDLWCFENGKWNEVKDQGGPKPGPRLCTAAALTSDGSELILFGGWDPETPGTGGAILDDVWSLDLATRTWSQLEAPMPHGPTSRHVAVCVPGAGIVVHSFSASTKRSADSSSSRARGLCRPPGGFTAPPQWAGNWCSSEAPPSRERW